MVKLFKSTKALAFILNILLARDTFAQNQIRGITANDFNKFEVEKSDPFLDAKVQANFEFCESIPGFISMLLCAFVPFYEKICPDNCGSAEDDDDGDNATSVSLNNIIQQQKSLDEIVQENFEFCESIPCVISKLLCANVAIYANICPDNCGSDDDDINATSILLSDSYMIIQQEEHIDEMVQANFEFCESIPGFISMLLCAFVPFYEKICPDNCGSAEDDDGDDDNNATSLLLSESNVIIQPEERLFEMVQGSLEFCDSIPSFITKLLCAFVPKYEIVCCDACRSEEDDDNENDDNINATSVFL